MKNTKIFFGNCFALAAIFSFFYILIWWGIVQPILSVAGMIDSHTLTAMAVVIELLKFWVRPLVAIITSGILAAIALMFFDSARKPQFRRR